MASSERYSTTVLMQPFVHQVGGHSSIQQFDEYTVCKPLFSKELRFYQEVCPLFKRFIPEFRGVVRVKNVAENGDSRWQMVNSGDNIKLHIYRYGKHCSSCSCQQKSESETNQTCKEGLGTFPNDGGGNGPAVNSNHDRNFDDSSLEYLLLENVVGNYKYPCILDLKMGTEKHKDYIVSQEEADRRQARWDQSTSKSLGVRICGMKVYLVTRKEFLVKSLGKDLTIEGFKDTIKEFLFNGEYSRYDVIEPILKQLGELLNIMEHQSSYRFYNTSLLLIYEGDVSGSKNGTSYSTNIEEDDQRRATEQRKSLLTNVGVRMIDFAHVHYNNQDMNSDLRQVLDEGYLFGLRSVIRILEETLGDLQSKKNPPRF